MKRVVPFVVSCVLMSSGAWAQTPPPPPPPPVPVTPPATVPPPPATAPSMPTPPATVIYRDSLMAPVDVAPMIMPMIIQTPRPTIAVPPHDFSFTFPDVVWDHQTAIGLTRGSDAYSVAISQLERRQYEQAIASFDRVIAAKGPKTDAATHWKAFSQFRLGRWDDSLATIAQLRKDYPQSRYLGEAKALEADVRRFSGQRTDPAQIDDDDIKLIALSGLQRTDPERAVPLVEQVLNNNNSLAVKKRALFVLAQSELPRAQQVLLSYAKGQGNPDLQATAIGYVASRRGQTTGKDLMSIYESTTDQAIRMAIINAFRTSGSREPLVMIATDHAAPQPMRERAVSNLNGLISPQELLTLYQKESNRDLRIQMVNVFSSMRAVDQLTQIVRNEKEPAVRQRAIRALGGLAPEQTGKTLSELYDTNSDIETRRTIVAALGAQNNADALIAIARKETNLSIKSEIVKRIADLAPKSKAAADYLAEIVR